MQEAELVTEHPALAHEIQSIVEQANQFSEQSNFNKSTPMYELAWNKLPEPRERWDLAQWICMSAFQDFMASNDLESARLWAERSFLARPSEFDFSSLIDLGWLEYRCGNLDIAYSWLDRAYQIEGRAAFSDYPREVWDFFQSARKKK